jgi:peptidoglycan/xylan/chitin deacetylase (PgdA/CDA1 family)
VRSRAKFTILLIAKYLGLFLFSRHLTRRGLRILAYHGIWIGDGHFGNFLFMQPRKFARRMNYVHKSSFPVLPLAEAVDRFQSDEHPDCCTVITIDDGWYGSYKHMVPVLTSLEMPATIYSTTYYSLKQQPVFEVALRYIVEIAPDIILDLADLNPDLAGQFDLADPRERSVVHEILLEFSGGRLDSNGREKLCGDLAEMLRLPYSKLTSERTIHLMSTAELMATAERGVDIQLHTHRHRFRADDPDDIRNEISENRERLLGISKSDLDHFCYPSGVYDLRHKGLLKELGIKSATTMDYGINFEGADAFALARLSDGQEVSQLEFEAELSGFNELWRRVRGRHPSKAGSFRLGDALRRIR